MTTPTDKELINGLRQRVMFDLSLDAERFKLLVDRLETANATIEDLENRLFKLGEMENPPCFICGYNGQNYYQPSVHKCAERHHALAKKDRTND